MSEREAPFPMLAHLANVDWQPVPVLTDGPGDLSLPHATHAGVWTEPLFGLRMRCYRLNNGQAVFHEEDFRRLMDRIANSLSGSEEKPS